jgi:hypothetical protein
MLLFVLWRKVLAVMVVYVAVYTTSELELSPQPPTAHYFSRRRLRHKSEQRKPVYQKISSAVDSGWVDTSAHQHRVQYDTVRLIAVHNSSSWT